MPTVGAFVGPWVGPSSVATALLLASVLLPAPAAAGGFWQVAPGGPLAPGWTVAATGAAAVEAALRDEAGGAGSPPSAPMLRLPRLTERLGLVVSAGSGRPKLAGLGFRATRNLRVSARGGVDFEAGGISGEVSVAFEF